MIEKILSALENASFLADETFDEDGYSNDDGIEVVNLETAKEIVREVAKEYETSYMEQLVEAKRNCSEDSDCSECPFGQIEDRCILAELQMDADKNRWIPCSERLPKESELVLIYAESTARGGSIRCVAELHNGFWFAQIASDTLGLSGIGQFNVIAWQPLPAPYQKEIEIAKGAIAYEGCTNADRIRAMSDEELARFLDEYRAETIGNEWCLHLCPQRLAGAEECDCPYDGYETTLGWLKAKKREQRG